VQKNSSEKEKNEVQRNIKLKEKKDNLEKEEKIGREYCLILLDDLTDIITYIYKEAQFSLIWKYNKWEIYGNQILEIISKSN
jgi:hypothetical protein